ncbi:MAG TPA: hypothetical protein PLZ93_13685 [Nocardioides sp.]|uniref:hypothetical protein n=1 Tax=uncultured Nocardioides sp. TaxID=198441 RepID=UPI000EE57046|nr:hypothetical protein [uncultured Nocardioides sp.]HCB04007.1 hypothetical protein [Nocardioides sp.]HRD62001.1 hypothetical protein [Nocardioides sp.]HRI96661.1 hypothetical protein [Nocardioides sp.]HRK47116.1 hypothetical protein [Nocardioides sp.]
MSIAHVETHLPAAKQIKDLFVDLLDREVTLATVSPLTPSARSPRTVGVYVDDQYAVRAIVVCDLEFSARAGAALALVPSPTADHSIEARLLDQALAENLYEVLNVAASLFNVSGAAHVRLHQLHAAGAPIPAPLQSLMVALGRREDVELGIAGYGSGRLSIVLC